LRPAWRSPAAAQKSASQAIDEYRAMLADGNPAELFEAKGEDLWKQKRGPKNASLEKCDLGKGPGVVKGAFVELPRYFADTGKRAGPGVAPADLHGAAAGLQRRRDRQDAVRQRASRSQRRRLVAYLGRPNRAAWPSTCRKATRWSADYEVGKRLFFMRGGTHDFACASCHGEDGKRIRLQDLPNLTKNPGDGVGFAAWPAYRVSSGEMWSMQRA
jgi:sulfur-oxidizing protein SoxA